MLKPHDWHVEACLRDNLNIVVSKDIMFPVNHDQALFSYKYWKFTRAGLVSTQIGLKEQLLSAVVFWRIFPFLRFR